MKAIKDIYTYQLPYYNYPVLKQVGTNEQANANKLPFDVLVDPNNHQPITLDLGAGEKIYCQVCVATMNFNSVDYLCAMLVEKQHASNIVAKGEGANVTFAVFDIKTKKGKRATDPLITTSLVEFYKILSKNKRKVVRRDLFYITEKLQDMEGTSARVVTARIEARKANRNFKIREWILAFYIPVCFIFFGYLAYSGLCTPNLQNWFEQHFSDTQGEAKSFAVCIAVWALSALPAILLYYASSRFYRIKKPLRVFMMVLSGIMMAGLSVWQFLPLVIPNGWQGYESFVSLAVFIPSAFSIIGFLVFYVHKYKGKKYANTLVLNLLAPLLFTVLLLVSIALILGWLVIMAIGLLDKSINMPRDSSDGPQQSVRIWGTGDDFNDVTHSDSYYSSRHGCHVDEYRDERGNKYLSPDGGNTFYEDN